nr:hypothetical protein [Mixta theicola]
MQKHLNQGSVVSDTTTGKIVVVQKKYKYASSEGNILYLNKNFSGLLQNHADTDRHSALTQAPDLYAIHLHQGFIGVP